MNVYCKYKIRILVLLIYLVTVQLGVGSTFSSTYFSFPAGTSYFKEKTKRQIPRNQPSLRKHIAVSNNEKSSNNQDNILHSISLPEVKLFSYLKAPKKLVLLTVTVYGTLRDRAPPKTA